MSKVERPPGWVRVMAGIHLGLWEDGSTPTGIQATGDNAVSDHEQLFTEPVIAGHSSGLFGQLFFRKVRGIWVALQPCDYDTSLG